MSLEESRKRKTPPRDEEEVLKNTPKEEPQTKIVVKESKCADSDSNLTVTDFQTTTENIEIVDHNLEKNKEKTNEHETTEKKSSFEVSLSVTNVSDVTMETGGKEPEEPVENSQPSILIKFRDTSVANQYKSSFIKFISSFVELEIKNQDKFTIEVEKDDYFNPEEWAVIDETIATETNTQSPSKKKKKKSKAKKELFIVDATPSQHSHQLDLRYTSKFTISTEKPSEENVDKPKQQTCFNCDQPHSLKDCREPKNYAKINEARQKFKQHQPLKSS